MIYTTLLFFVLSIIQLQAMPTNQPDAYFVCQSCNLAIDNDNNPPIVLNCCHYTAHAICLTNFSPDNTECSLLKIRQLCPSCNQPIVIDLSVHRYLQTTNNNLFLYHATLSNNIGACFSTAKTPCSSQNDIETLGNKLPHNVRTWIEKIAREYLNRLMDIQNRIVAYQLTEH